MNIGMLWFDDSSKPINEKVRQAVQYYAAKYGRTPTHCLVNPETTSLVEEVDNIQVVAAATVMPDHFWVGFDSIAAPAHIGHGSRVQYSTQLSSRQSPKSGLMNWCCRSLDGG